MHHWRFEDWLSKTNFDVSKYIITRVTNFEVSKAAHISFFKVTISGSSESAFPNHQKYVIRVQHQQWWYWRFPKRRTFSFIFGVRISGYGFRDFIKLFRIHSTMWKEVGCDYKALRIWDVIMKTSITDVHGHLEKVATHSI